LFSSSGLRLISSSVCLLALASLSALPAEHVHAADPAGIHSTVVHRHLDDDATDPDPDRPEHHDDHATARPLSRVFQISPKFAPTSPVVVTATLVLAREAPFVGLVGPCYVVPIHSPPSRLLPSRAPPAHA